MAFGQVAETVSTDSVVVINRAGRGRVVLLCDHASNRIPEEFGKLGLEAADLDRHVAWDPGAMPVARMMSRLLDAPLVASNVSRLLVDCNRPADAPDLIPAISETTEIPDNANLDAAARRARIELAHVPFHGAIENVVGGRVANGEETWLVSIHTFTPVYRDVERPWEIGILHDDDERLSAPLLVQLKEDENLTVGDNAPYSPADRVYYTLTRHGRLRSLPCVMIEIRNDEVVSEDQQRKWAERLAGILQDIRLGESGPAGT